MDDDDDDDDYDYIWWWRVETWECKIFIKKKNQRKQRI